MSYGPVIVLDKTQFRLRFPQFASGTAFPDAALDVNWIISIQYISPANCGDLIDGGRELAIQLMLAHILALGVIEKGNGDWTGQAGIVTQATIDKVTVALAVPPYGTDNWRYWLNLTPYGQQLLALLSAQAVGGFYIPGGPPERNAFRKGYGLFF